MRSCCVAQAGLEQTELLSALSCLFNMVRCEPTVASGSILHELFPWSLQCGADYCSFVRVSFKILLCFFTGLFVCFKTGSCPVAQAGPEFMVLFPRPHECCDSRCMPTPSFLSKFYVKSGAFLVLCRATALQLPLLVLSCIVFKLVPSFLGSDCFLVCAGRRVDGKCVSWVWSHVPWVHMNSFWEMILSPPRNSISAVWSQACTGNTFTCWVFLLGLFCF